MDFCCQRCGHRIILDAPPAAREVQCPSCGARQALPHAPAIHRPLHDEDLPRPNPRRLRRIFEPIPRPFSYLVGAILVLVVLAPFWVYLLKERLERQRPMLSDDAVSIPVPASTETSPAPPALEQPGPESTTSINEFQSIQLEADLEGLQRRYSLHLLNTRGMTPEIYEASRIGDIDHVTLHFYGNSLKEFWVEMRERHVAPDQIEKELEGQFGDPKERAVHTGAQNDSVLGLRLPATATTAAAAGNDVQRKLAAFPYRVELTWTDNESLAEATIYYTSPQPTSCSSLLAVHLSAAHWLENNRAEIGSVVTPVPSLTNSLSQTNETPSSQDRPKRLFP